jgi:hypothetical protein
MPPHIEKCKSNLENGFRPYLLVPAGEVLNRANIMAELGGLGGSIAILSIETFVGQNVDEIAGFQQARLESDFRRLLEEYNRRVGEVEHDPSMLIEIPQNLGLA